MVEFLFSFFFSCFLWSLSWSSSCFLTFLFSFINSHLRSSNAKISDSFVKVFFEINNEFSPRSTSRFINSIINEEGWIMNACVGRGCARGKINLVFFFYRKMFGYSSFLLSYLAKFVRILIFPILWVLARWRAFKNSFWGKVMNDLEMVTSFSDV